MSGYCIYQKAIRINMKINLSEFASNKVDHISKFYTLIGYENFIDEDGFPRSSIEDSSVCARAIKNKQGKKFNSDIQYRFYIKTDPNKNIYNPIEIYSSIKDKQSNSFLNKICKAEQVFTEVTPQVFGLYINFLKTKNIRWLNEAQRELK